jgi:hypothetical protein
LAGESVWSRVQMSWSASTWKQFLGRAAASLAISVGAMQIGRFGDDTMLVGGGRRMKRSCGLAGVWTYNPAKSYLQSLEAPPKINPSAPVVSATPVASSLPAAPSAPAITSLSSTPSKLVTLSDGRRLSFQQYGHPQGTFSPLQTNGLYLFIAFSNPHHTVVVLVQAKWCLCSILPALPASKWNRWVYACCCLRVVFFALHL